MSHAYPSHKSKSFEYFFTCSSAGKIAWLYDSSAMQCTLPCTFFRLDLRNYNVELLIQKFDIRTQKCKLTTEF